jgi:hypothetical protein
MQTVADSVSNKFHVAKEVAVGESEYHTNYGKWSSFIFIFNIASLLL